VFHDGAGSDLIDTLSLQAVSIHDTAQRSGEHFLVSHLRIGPTASGKWDANAADYGDTPRCCSDQH